MKLLYKICEHCNKEFSIRTWRKNRFCSNNCSNLNKVSTPEKLLMQGEKISKKKLGIARSQETKDKISNFRKGKTATEIMGIEGANNQKRAVILSSSKPKSKEHIKNWIESRQNNGWFKEPNKRRGFNCKLYDTIIGTVQGKSELEYINSLIKNKEILPKIPKGIKTPFGTYYPDFEFEDKYIEIKSTFTFDVFNGKFEKFKNKQKEKLIWVSKNIKPVNIFIYNKSGICENSVKYPDLDITGRVL